MVVSDEWIAYTLLFSVPALFDPMVMALENSSTPITVDLIKSKILRDVKNHQKKPGQSSAVNYHANFYPLF